MKLSFKEKLGYGIGEIAGSGLWQTMMFFLPIFYTETYGLSPAATATLFLVVRIFDALNDPIMGAISDRTNTRWGKFRPYLLWGSVPFGIFAFLMFATPDFSDGGKLAYAYITYFMVLVFYTILMVPYNSLLGVMTSNPNERNSLSVFKFVLAYSAGIMVQALIVPLVDKLGGGNDALGYKLTMSGLAVISVIALIVVFFTTKERIQPDPKIKSNLKADLTDLTRNRPYLVLLGASLIFLIYICVRSAAVMYYFEYYLGRKDLASIFMVSGTFAVIAGVLPTKWLAKKFDKKNIVIWCMMVICLSLLVNYFAGPENIVLIFATQLLFSLASGPLFPLIWTMLADAADYSEWKTGRRATGLIYSASTFAQKTGAAVGAAIMLLIIQAYGYISNQPQTDSSLQGIRLTMTLVPALIATFGMGLVFFYNLSNKKLAEIEIDLNERRKNN
ncbi:MAG: MFS transporter [Prolixibacteraceae bacterium]